MSEPSTELQPQGSADVPSSETNEVSWEDAMEDLERQKDMIKETVPPSPTGQKPDKRPSQQATVQESRGTTPSNLQFILDIPLQVTVELGRKRLLVQDLLQLSQGSVIELSKQIGEPFEVLVNQKLIARGEVVVINDKFGVRITDIISPMERVQQL